MVSPEMRLKWSRMSRISFSCLRLSLYPRDLRSRVRSSAYPSAMVWRFFLEVQGVMSLEAKSLRRRISMARMKRYPATGSPCLQPLSRLIVSPRQPLTKVLDLKPERRVLIQLMNLSSKLNFFMVFLMKE